MNATDLQKPKKPRRHIAFHPVALARGLIARPKLYWAAAAGALTFFAAPFVEPTMQQSVRAILSWNVAATIYLAIAVYVFSTCTGDRIRTRAEEEDETRFVFGAIVLIAVVASFVAALGSIGEATRSKEAVPLLLAVSGGLGVLFSWLVLQVVFTLHYAHDYYHPSRDDAPSRGLDFPGDDKPDYWDFFYFTTSIGATSQTSDVAIETKAMRRTVAFQAVLSFVFNTAIVAFSINLAASLFQK